MAVSVGTIVEVALGAGVVDGTDGFVAVGSKAVAWALAAEVAFEATVWAGAVGLAGPAAVQPPENNDNVRKKRMSLAFIGGILS